MSEAYKAAGVDLELGDEISGMLGVASEYTDNLRKGSFGTLTRADDTFYSLRGMNIGSLIDLPSAHNIDVNLFDDGIGTKVEIAQRMRDHSTIAFDLFAMVSEDAAIKGFEPVAVSTTFDVSKLHESQRPYFEQLAVGYVAAAKATGVTIVNGEVAELGDLVGGYRGTLLERLMDKIKHRVPLQYNWSATLLAAAHQDRAIDGRGIQVGDTIVGFREDGFRSNGLTLARKLLRKHYGNAWHKKNMPGSDQKIGSAALHPSTIYTPVFVDAFGGFDLDRKPKAELHGAAHITGGGMPGKLGRALKPSGLGAEIASPYRPAPLMSLLQFKGGIPDDEIYKVWNMGMGAVAITPEPFNMLALAHEHGKAAAIIGEVTRESGINIRSHGAFSPGTILTYER
jgi:phosphoribosylformylglycinamidine cyclo-ligase